MKFLCYLQCIINTMLIVMITTKIIREENFYHLFIIALFVPMVVFGWCMVLRIYKKKK